MKRTMRFFSCLLMFLVLLALIRSARAEDASESRQENDSELAQKLTNPLADLMTIPIQMN